MGGLYDLMFEYHYARYKCLLSEKEVKCAARPNGDMRIRWKEELCVVQV